MGRIHRHLTYANVISTLALFLVLGGGTALAAYVVSSNSQIGPGTVSGHKPPTGDHANIIAGSVNGQDVADNSLTGADISPSALSRGRSTDSSCNPPNTSVFVDCGSLTINLTRPARVLIVTSADWFSSGTGNPSSGVCRIVVDGAPSSLDHYPGEDTDTSSVGAENSLALTNVTGLLAAGSHNFGLACGEQSGDIVFENTSVSAVVLGSG